MLTVISISPSHNIHPRCAIPAWASKHSQRLLSSLSFASNASVASRIIRNFVSSSSKSTALQALFFFISRSSPFSLYLYQTLCDSPSFKCNSKLSASLISLLEDQHRPLDAQDLISQMASSLQYPGDLALFYCDLIDAFSDRRLKLPVLRTYALLKEIPFSGRRLYETMVKAMCLIGMPGDAEEFLQEMGLSGFKPSSFEFRSVVQAYGRVGAFGEMTRVLRSMQENCCSINTVCINIVLSCYGDHRKFSEMVSWIHKMRESDIEFSKRSFNSVLNSCPTFIMIMKDFSILPLSIEAFFRKVEEESHYLDELFLLKEMANLGQLKTMVEWLDSDVKLDLHGLHLTTAYLVILLWLEEVRSRLISCKDVPMEFSIICGSGKHSKVKGESPIKKLVSVMMFKLKSPLKLDRINVGKFIAKGNSVRDWLC